MLEHSQVLFIVIVLGDAGVPGHMFLCLSYGAADLVGQGNLTLQI